MNSHVMVDELARFDPLANVWNCRGLGIRPFVGQVGPEVRLSLMLGWTCFRRRFELAPESSCPCSQARVGEFPTLAIHRLSEWSSDLPLQSPSFDQILSKGFYIGARGSVVYDGRLSEWQIRTYIRSSSRYVWNHAMRHRPEFSGMGLVEMSLLDFGSTKEEDSPYVEWQECIRRDAWSMPRGLTFVLTPEVDHNAAEIRNTCYQKPIGNSTVKSARIPKRHGCHS